MPIRVSSFEDLRDEFDARVGRIVWCTFATIDEKNRPRSRILHPIWRGSTGWVLTGRHSTKARHLAHSPYVSLCYWDAAQQQVYAECTAGWIDDPAEKRRIWDLFKNTPEPVGYDPALFWPAGATDPTFGVLELTPWRVEICGLQELMTGQAKVWVRP